jgi:membrane-associated phospholipid phosphatase
MKLSTIVVLVMVSAGRAAFAQTPDEQVVTDGPAVVNQAPTAPAPNLAAPAPDLLTLRPPTPSLFRSIERDVPAFFSTQTATILGSFALAGLAVRPFDKAGVEDTSERLSKGAANIGNWGGSLYVQAGGALATYVVGRATGNQRIASLGGDLMRAQALSQMFVQGAKFAVARKRPDASNSLSFPSGHSASSFATATVLQQHFGWKVGIPAYAFAGFVGASRLASSKHYLSDVVVGAGIGIAAGRTVTLHLGHNQFSLGAAPTQGGAMVTFTKR